MHKIAYINIIKQIQSGGTSKIYLGISELDGFPYVVKEFDPNLFKNPALRELFKEEANRYLYLDHPNIIQLENLLLLPQYDTGYMVLEYIEGHNLKEHINTITGGRFPVAMAAQFIYETLKPLHYAHQEGFVHNDIKPSNIMLKESSDGTFFIKLIDFGISLRSNNQPPVEQMFTPYYASPEQTIAGQVVDIRSDIYSMGITFYELLAGRTPFSGRNLSRNEVIEKVRSEPCPLIGFWEPFDIPLSGQVNEIIARATQKNPDDRYQNCAEFMEDIEVLMR